MSLNAPAAGAYTASLLYNSKLRPKGAAKSTFVPVEEEAPQYRPAINAHSRRVSSSLASLEDRQFDEQHKRQVRLSQLAQVVEGERKANETFAPRTNKTPVYLNMDSRVPLSERTAPNRNIEQPLDPEATHKPKINENGVDKDMVALNAAVRKRVRELWSQHAEGSTMSVSGILAALADLGIKEPSEDASDEALDKYDAVVDKFLAAMGVDESVEELRYAQYDRFSKVLSTVAKSTLNPPAATTAISAAPAPRGPTGVVPHQQDVATTRRDINHISTSSRTVPSSATTTKPFTKPKPFKVFTNKQFDVENDESDEEEGMMSMGVPQRNGGGMRQQPPPQATPRSSPQQQHQPPNHNKAISSVSPQGNHRHRSEESEGGPSASLDYFRSPSSQTSHPNHRNNNDTGGGQRRDTFGGVSPSLSPPPSFDSIDVHSPSPQNPTSNRRPLSSSRSATSSSNDRHQQQRYHQDPLAATTAPPPQTQTQTHTTTATSRPSSSQSRTQSSAPRSQQQGVAVPIPQRLGGGVSSKTTTATPRSRSQSSSAENSRRPPSRSSSFSRSNNTNTATDQNESIQRLYSGSGPNSSLVVQEEYSFKPAINPHSNHVEQRRAELGGLLRSRMSSKTLERQQKIAKEIKEREVSGCTFAPETVSRRPPTVYRYKKAPSSSSLSPPHQSCHGNTEEEINGALPADPPGFDKAIQRMAEGRKRAVPKFEELLRSSIALTTTSNSSRPTTSSSLGRTKSNRPPTPSSASPSEIDDNDDGASDVELPPATVTEPKPFNLHAQHRVQERKEHKLLLFIDVDLPNGKTGRIGVHRGDDPETLSHNFCVTYSLDPGMKANLCTMLAEKIEVTLRAEEVRKSFALKR